MYENGFFHVKTFCASIVHTIEWNWIEEKQKYFKRKPIKASHRMRIPYMNDWQWQPDCSWKSKHNRILPTHHQISWTSAPLSAETNLIKKEQIGHGQRAPRISTHIHISRTKSKDKRQLRQQKKTEINHRKQQQQQQRNKSIEKSIIMELMESRQSHVATRFNYDDDTNSGMHYGNLVKQSSMNSFFNVNDFIESSTIVPDPDNVAESLTTSSAILIVKCFVFGFIILAAIFGNMLVIVSVMQHRKLR